MKIGYIILIMVMSFSANAQKIKFYYDKNKNIIPVIITPAKNQKEPIDGIGMEFYGTITLDNQVPKIEIKNCGLIELPNIYDAQNQLNEKSKLLKNGDTIKYKFKSMNSCDIAGWNKI